MELLTKVHKLGIIPIGQGFIEELGIVEIFDRCLRSGGEEITHGRVLNVLLLNILDSIRPLYKVSEWLRDYSDGIGELGIVSDKYHDKRLGSALDALYAGSRDTILTEISSRAIALHGLKTDRIHNDTTSVTFLGAYEGASGPNQEVSFCRGYNKDHRPDMKQVVFGLNVCADGFVPLLSHIYSGNQSDSGTHRHNWETLRALLGKVDFVYIADSKLSSMENLTSIDGAGGKFISVLSGTRKEVREFYESLEQDQTAASGTWEVGLSKANSRKKGEQVLYRLYEGSLTQEGFRLIFVHSSSKAVQDAQSRQAAIERSRTVLEHVVQNLNEYYLKTEAQIQSYIKENAGTGMQFFDIKILEDKQMVKRKVGAGRVGPNSVWREEAVLTYKLTFSLNQERIDTSAKTDGVFPLVTNTVQSAAQVLADYKDQPYLEKRFNTLKSVLEVAPVFLKKPERVEAMLLLHLIALMLIALIERKLKNEMERQAIKELPILPQKMKTAKPTWGNIRFLFSSVIIVYNVLNGQQQTITLKGVGKEHIKVIELLGIALEYYKTPVQFDWVKNDEKNESIIQKINGPGP